MSGLIYKDLIIMKNQWKTMAFILVVWLGLCIVQKNPYFFSEMITIYGLLIPLNGCAFDEKSRWDRIALTLPVNRNTVVLSKYVVGLLMIALCSLISIPVFFLMGAEAREVMAAECTLRGIELIMFAIVVPLMLMFGVERARYIISGLFICIFVVFTMVIPQLDISLPNILPERFAWLIVWVFPVVGLCAVVVSMFMSVWIYSRKEF